MEEITRVAVHTITIFGKTITFNPEMLMMTWLVMGLLVVFSIVVSRSLRLIPHAFQSIIELLQGFFHEIVIGSLGEEDGKRYLPLIVSLFCFILISNWMGLIPNVFQFIGICIALIHKLVGGNVKIVVESWTNIIVTPPAGLWYYFMFHVPGFVEPTKTLSTDVALGLTVFFTVHAYGIRHKGFVAYCKSYLEPMPAEGIWLWLFFLNPFLYMNIISQFASTLSHSCRLFGNIFGGGIIIIIVSELLRYVGVPIILMGFFGLFSGTVQAFVFTMLAISYITQQR